MMEPSEIRDKLTVAFPGADVELVDLTGTKDHYQARIVASAFEGKSPIEQHRLVYAALGEAMHGPIHALTLTTHTPSTWAKLKKDK